MIPRVRNNFIAVVAISIMFFQCEKTIYTYDKTDPVVTVVPTILEVSDFSATIYWETDEACHARIKYGLSSGDYDSVFEVTENRQIHTETITNLQPFMTYYFKIYNWDFADNGPIKTDEQSFKTLHNEHSYIREGWGLYANHDYSGALSMMNQALAINNFNPEIHASLGWVLLRLDSLAQAREKLEFAYYLNPYLPLTLTGKALLAKLDDLPNIVIDYCQLIISREPEWSYAYYPKINIQLVRLLLAEAFVQTNRQSDAQAELDQAWTDNGLDPNIPVTWIVDHVTYNNYETALIAAIKFALSQQFSNV